MAGVELEHVTPILNVANVPASMAWFERLGWKRSFAWNQGGMIANAGDSDQDGEADYGGVISGNVEIFLCCGAQGARRSAGQPIQDDTAGVWMTWWLASPELVERLYEKAMSSGVDIIMPVTRQPWNACEFRLRHPDGHVFRVSAFFDS